MDGVETRDLFQSQSGPSSASSCCAPGPLRGSFGRQPHPHSFPPFTLFPFSLFLPLRTSSSADTPLWEEAEASQTVGLRDADPPVPKCRVTPICTTTPLRMRELREVGVRLSCPYRPLEIRQKATLLHFNPSASPSGCAGLRTPSHSFSKPV